MNAAGLSWRGSAVAVAAVRVVAVVVEVTGTRLRETAGEQIADRQQGDEEPCLVGAEVVTDIAAVVAGLARGAVRSDRHRGDQDADGDNDVEPELGRLPRRLRLCRDPAVAGRRAGGETAATRVAAHGGGARSGRRTGGGCCH